MWKRNTVVVIGAAAAFYLYLYLTVSFVSMPMRFWAGVVIGPLSLGIVGYVLLRGPLFLRTTLIAVSPIIVGIIAPEDPAYPGLGFLLSFPISGITLIGALISAALIKLFSSNKRTEVI